MKDVGNAGGALWMLGSALSFTISMSLVKFLGADYPAVMQGFVRQLIGFVALLPFILPNPRAVFATSHLGLIVARGASASIAIILGYYSYQKLPLAEANALSFSRALWLVPLAILFLGERIGRPRLIATLVGFGGVVVVLRPTSPGSFLGIAAFCGLASAVLIALSVTGLKALTRSHGSLSMLAWAALLGTLFTFPAAIPEWRLPGVRDGLLLLVMGLTGVISQFCYIRGLAMGDATVLAPIDYSRIIFTALFGAVAFGERPSASTWIGVAIIVGSALFITWTAGRYRTVETRPAIRPGDS